MSQIAKAWTLADAKAHLSEVVESALTKGPQVITRHGRKAVVVVAAEEWERKTRRGKEVPAEPPCPATLPSQYLDGQDGEWTARDR